MRNRRTHTYRVRPAIGGPAVLTSTIERQNGTITATAANGGTITMDVLTARAMWITIHEAVYEQRSLLADGPTLTLECDGGTGRSVVVGRDTR
jgi:hypothetical protein